MLRVARESADETRHRVVVQIAIGALVALSVLPLTGQLEQLVTLPLERCRELLSHCVLALRSSGATLHWLPWVLGAAGLAYAVLDRLRLARRVSQVLACHRARRPRRGEPIHRLARKYKVDSRVRILLEPAPNPAFTAGVFIPRMYLADALARELTPAELRATFRHELHHVRRRDPLRFAALRFVAKALFWLPLVRILTDDLMEDAELMADDFATTGEGASDPLDVASALVKIGHASARAIAGTVGIGGFRLLDRRVRRLASEPAVIKVRIPLRLTLVSLFTLALIWGASVVVPGAANAADPARTGERCRHSGMPGAEHCPRCDTMDRVRAFPCPHQR